MTTQRSHPGLWFDQDDCRRVEVAGGKGSSLASMASLGLPVPPGFLVPAAALDMAAFADEVGFRRASALLLSNPANPTGRTIRGLELAGWVEAARRLDCTLLLDDARRVVGTVKRQRRFGARIHAR